jgi:predicted enzyme related to lactoylglutathione lyase
MGPQWHPVVHLELHTGDLAGAARFYSRLLRWRPTTVEAGSACYTAMELGRRLGGGIVECGTERPMWLPYVQVESVEQVTARAWEMGATVLLEPREGPAGWRSVVAVPGGAELALWHPKEAG